MELSRFRILLIRSSFMFRSPCGTYVFYSNFQWPHMNFRYKTMHNRYIALGNRLIWVSYPPPAPILKAILRAISRKTLIFQDFDYFWTCRLTFRSHNFQWGWVGMPDHSVSDTILSQVATGTENFHHNRKKNKCCVFVFAGSRRFRKNAPKFTQAFGDFPCISVLRRFS